MDQRRVDKFWKWFGTYSGYHQS